MATYTGTLGAQHALPGFSHYAGLLGAAPQLPRLWWGTLGTQPALWASVWQGVMGGTAYQHGEPVEPPTATSGGTTYENGQLVELPSEQQVVYHATLTGGPDGLPDLALPAASFQFSATLFVDVREASLDLLVFVNGILIYSESTPRQVIRGFDYRVQVTVPGLSLASAVRARPNGELVLERTRTLTDGSTQTHELYRGPFQELETRQGARRSNLQLRGNASTEDLPERRGVRIQDLFQTTVDKDDKLRFQASPTPELRPRDQVVVEGTAYEVKEVQMQVGPSEFNMDVQCGSPVA